MMNTRGGRLLGAAVCSGLIVLAGCGGDGGSNGDSDSRSPLEEFMGWDNQGWSSQDEASEEQRQEHYQVQEYVVECMANVGFDYFPEPFWGDQDRHSPEDDWERAYQLQEDDPEAFAKQYGYGFTTIGQIEESSSEGSEEPELDPEEFPNDAYRETLSSSAQEEYDKALWGDWDDVDESGAVEDGEPAAVDVGGCHNEAYKEIYDLGDDDDSQFEELWEAWDELYQRIEDDPRMTELAREWSQCMSEAGYSGLEGLQDGQEKVFERQDEIYGWDDGEVVLGGRTEEGEDAQTEEGEEPEFVEPSKEELEVLREFELAIAWADFECKRDHDGEQIEQEVRFEHEERFIEENREDLEAYRDWHNERGF